MGTVAEGDDDFSILEATAASRRTEDIQPLLQDQSAHTEEEDPDVMQNASYFALKKAFAALKVRLREVEHENERLHRQVKQLEAGSGEFGSSNAHPRSDLMPSINKAYEAYKEKCQESSQLKEQLSQMTQKWQVAESNLQQFREQLRKGCSKCAAQETARNSSRSTQVQTAQYCPRSADGCANCSEAKEQATQVQEGSKRPCKPTDPAPPPSDSDGSAPTSMASLLQEELDHTRTEMGRLRSLVRMQHQALTSLLASPQGQVKSPEPGYSRRDELATVGTSDIGSLEESGAADWSSHVPADRTDLKVRGHDPMVRGHDPMVGGLGVHPIQCADEIAAQQDRVTNHHGNNNNRNGDAEDLMMFSAGSNVTGRQTNQFSRTVANPPAAMATARTSVRPRYPPADGYHQLGGGIIADVPLPRGGQDRALENRFRQLGANQCVQTPIQYERNTEFVGRQDNVASNVNISQPEATAANQSPTQARQFAWLESGKEIPPQNIYAGTGKPEPNLNRTNSNSNEVGVQQSGEWGGQEEEVVVRGSPLEWDRECPMCQQVFPDDIPQEMFIQHVNAHFEEEEARHDGFELFQM